jgi:hypothetical protein
MIFYNKRYHANKARKSEKQYSGKNYRSTIKKSQTLLQNRKVL